MKGDWYHCVKRENVFYSINEDEKTVSVCRVEEGTSEFLIPQSIIIDSEEYAVTSILKYALKTNRHLKSIQFPIDSKMYTFEKKAFSFSTIQNITFPSSLRNLNNGWNYYSSDSMKIQIMPDNPYYKIYSTNYIIGKSSTESDDFDILVYCDRNIEKAAIPDFIKTVKSHAFHKCSKLREIEISINSKLQTIEKMAFSDSTIESIFIPSNLIELNKGWCKNTPKLTKITIDPNNSRYKLLNNQILIGKSNINQENYDTIVFSARDIEIAKIPNYIKIIEAYAFNKCVKLNDVQITIDSKLQVIEKYAFQETSIEIFSIPPCLEIISKMSFSNCSNLRCIDILTSSKLKRIEKLAFYNSSIEQLTIPPSLVDLENGWCNRTDKLLKIDVMPNNSRYIKYDDKIIIGKSSVEQQNYDTLVFCARNVKSATIPNFIEVIGVGSFNKCNIHSLEFETGSKLKIIDDDAFSLSSIKSISIPSTLKIIGKNAFYLCHNLNIANIPTNSELQTINERALSGCSFANFYIPRHIKIIYASTFSGCKNLKNVHISENSELQLIEPYAFLGSSITSLYIPRYVSSIYEKAFVRCFNLKIIEFDENYEFEDFLFSSYNEIQGIIFMIPNKLINDL